MDSLYVIRERMQDLYSRYSIVADKAIQFVLAVMTFYMINNNVGFMKTLASPVVVLALAIIATFFPPIITVILATALILVHMYSVSIAALVVTALIFLIMYIFYLRFTPKMAIVVLLTPLAFALKIPVVVPISCALLMSPISMVAVGCGTVVYYMMAYMKKAASGMQGGSVKGMMGQIGKYAKQVFQNKELWIVLVAFIICTLVVYTLRKQAIAHAWTIAVITGAVVNIVVVAIGDVAMGVHASYGSLITAWRRCCALRRHRHRCAGSTDAGRHPAVRRPFRRRRRRCGRLSGRKAGLRPGHPLHPPRPRRGPQLRLPLRGQVPLIFPICHQHLLQCLSSLWHRP